MNNIKTIARKEILNIDTYKPGKPIEELKRELRLKQVIKLASNENSFGVSPLALEAARKELSKVNRYPDGNCFYLKKRLCRKLNIKPENLILGNGSDEVINMVMRAFVNRGDEVIIAMPTFLIYRLAAQIAGANIKAIPLKNFRYDLKRMKAQVSKKTKVVFIANPDNPTGSFATKGEVAEFLKELPRNVLVYFDEAYYEFAAKNKDYPNTLRLARNMPNVIVSRSFSKAYGLSGLRVGFAVACKEIISCLEKVREPFNVNSVAQKAALAALDDTKFLKMVLIRTEQGKRFLYKNFKKLGLSYVESAANFILVKIPKDSTMVFKALLKKGVIVRDMKSWGLGGFIRISIGKENENIRLIKALTEVLKR